MSQPEKNTLNAQAGLDPLSAEAAIRLFPQQNNQFDEDIDPPTKDEDGAPPEILQYLIEVGSNGMFVTISYSDIDKPDERFIVHTLDEAIELMRTTV